MTFLKVLKKKKNKRSFGFSIIWEKKITILTHYWNRYEKYWGGQGGTEQHTKKEFDI